MADQSSQLVQKLWNYCNILRDDGLSYGDYVEQLTFLLFLKMADEQSRAPFNKPSPIPRNVDWQSPMRLDGDELETRYRHVLESLGKQKGVLGSPLGQLGKTTGREQNRRWREVIHGEG